ncbi:hypothetical protein BD779DRAFT_299506 [Infundibulicybe gibba]|nr:hypothetical protein BD779DRAFT_299506 [Infundibulicybe gibba]
MHRRAALAILISISEALCGAGTPTTSGPAAREFSLIKRFDQARFTFHNTDSVGACGEDITNTDFAVALDASQYQASTPAGSSISSLCGQSIIITANGKTTIAKIMDECPGCPFAGLDLTPGLFSFFAPLSDDAITGSWNFLSMPAN